jgi:uncharacterized membrane protein HdeD (DUF308 family)
MTAATAQAETRMVPWWMVLLEGIAGVILGLFLIANPWKTAIAVMPILGIFWMIDGIFSIVGIFMDSSRWGWKLFMGVIGILAGLFLIQSPIMGAGVIAFTYVLMVGIAGIVLGIARLIQAFQGAGWGAGVLGALSILFGILLLANPQVSTLVLPWVVGVFMLVGGFFAIFMSFKLKA